MSESVTHRKLVGKLHEWAEERVGHGNKSLILIDNFSKQPLPRIAGYVPDMFVLKINIVGEAKTSQDLQCRHTSDQLNEFLKFCSKNNSMFVMAVPWDMIGLADLLIKQRFRKNGFMCNYHVIKKLIV